MKTDLSTFMLQITGKCILLVFDFKISGQEYSGPSSLSRPYGPCTCFALLSYANAHLLKNLLKPLNVITMKVRKPWTQVLIAELQQPKGLPSGAPYSYGKEKETHEWIFTWLSWLTVLLMGAYARRRQRWQRRQWQRSCQTWRPYSS